MRKRVCAVIVENTIKMVGNTVTIDGIVIGRRTTMDLDMDCILIGEGEAEIPSRMHVSSGIASIRVSIPGTLSATIPASFHRVGRIMKITTDFIYKGKTYTDGEVTVMITNSDAMFEFKKRIEGGGIHIGGSNIGGVINTGDNFTYMG